MHLLKQQHAQDGMQFLGRPAEIRCKGFRKFIGRQFAEDLALEKTGPGLLHSASTFGADIVPGVQQVALFVVFYANQGDRSYVVDI